MIFYELKISYTRQTGEDNPKAVKETYLVEGLTAADVEERLLGEIQKYISGEWETKSCKQVQFYDLIPNPEGDQWYKARVEMITIEDSGKEKRKAAPGKEGKLGVEGMQPEVIIDALRKAGATIEDESPMHTIGAITKQDFMALGLSGGPNSSALRLALLKKLDMPEHMSANAMLQALNLLYTPEELEAQVAALEIENG
jgi:hypothetical protein